MDIRCEKCGKIMKDIQFYTYRNGDKTERCKKCLTMHIDNFKPETYLWLLEKMDIPYIPQKWEEIRDNAMKKNSILNGMSVFGKYLSQMKLNQYRDKGWKDSEELQKLVSIKNEERAQQQAEQDAMLKQQFENGEISEAEYKTLVSDAFEQKQQPKNNVFDEEFIEYGDTENLYNENNFMDIEAESEALITELTEEDKRYLLMKWGRLYKPSEWIELERDYNEMTASFDIQDADTKNSLILICKTNLKMNQSLDQGDIEGFQKLSKVSESLRKSAKFTAAQNKEEKSDFIDCVGNLVSICEKEGFIPRYVTDIPQDKVDLTLQDMNRYLYKLVTQDLGFGKQIEDALQKIKIQKEMNESSDEIVTDTFEELENQDYIDYYNDLQEQLEKDNNLGDEGADK